jgi:hypothetical protein
VLQLEVTIKEGFDESTAKFGSSDSVVIRLEHSLLSLSKWESEWEIPFLASEDKTVEQVVSYLRFMFVGEAFPENIIPYLTKEHFDEINAYINKKMTATWFGETKNQIQGEVVTAELIYYWMIALGIPFECESWHLSRLLTLIRVCNVKNSKAEKKAPGQAAAERRILNEQRKRQLGTKG